MFTKQLKFNSDNILYDESLTEVSIPLSTER